MGWFRILIVIACVGGAIFFFLTGMHLYGGIAAGVGALSLFSGLWGGGGGGGYGGRGGVHGYSDDNIHDTDTTHVG